MLLRDFGRFFTEESPIAAVAGHIEIVNLFGRPATEVLKSRSRQLNKYLSAYLAKRFTRKQRRMILLHHYRYLENFVPDDFYARILEQPCVLWAKSDASEFLEIALAPNFSSRYEGELTIFFSAAGISIFELSFTVVPGVLIGSVSDSVMLIGRVQGGRRFDLFRIATKACADISPKYLLMAAAQSVAEALGLRTIIGVSNDDQVGNPEIADPFYIFDYNEFWESLLAVKTKTGFYELPLPFPQKPLSEVSSGNRPRRRRQRHFKDGVGLAVAQALASKLAMPRALLAAESRIVEDV